MKKYKIGNYIISANSITDAVEIAKTIKDAQKHDIKFDGARIEFVEGKHNTSGVNTWTTLEKINSWLERENLSTYEKYKKDGGGYDKAYVDLRYLIDGKKHHVFHGARIDLGESTTVDKMGNSDIDYAKTLIEKYLNSGNSFGIKKLDSTKDSVTVRDIIQSLVDEETSAVSSYNVALETLKDHIPTEAYEAIKAIRDDEQTHIENLYAVLNGNVTQKNLEN